MANKAADPFRREEERILLVDTELRTVARFGVAASRGSHHIHNWLAADMNGDGLLELLWLKDDVTVFKVRR